MQKDDEKPLFQYISFFSGGDDANNSQLNLSEDVISKELNPLFDEIGDNLGFFSNNLYEDVMKQYIKKLWKDICMTSEYIVLNFPSILTIKQIKTIGKILDSTKVFLFGDGELLSVRHFDDLAEYRRILRILDLYPLPSPELKKTYEKGHEFEILSILKVRGGTDEVDYIAKKSEELWRTAKKPSC